MYRKPGWGLAACAVLLALCVWALSAVPLQLGIDLRGGTELIYQLDLSRIERDRAQVSQEVKDIIAKRLNAYGLKELSVSAQGEDRLVIQLPGTDSQAVEDLKRQIETAGSLTFRLVAPQSLQTDDELDRIDAEESVYLAADRDWVRRKLEDPNFNDRRPEPPRYIVRSEVERQDVGDRSQFVPKEGSRKALNNRHIYDAERETWEPVDTVSGRYLSSVNDTVDGTTFRPAVAFKFRGEGATKFGDLTGANVGNLLAIVLDDDIMQVATIRDRISESGQLTGDFTSEDVRSIVTILRGGSLPTKPALISQSTVGAILGQDTIEAGIKAVILGTVAVMIFMLVYYRIGGIVADIALGLNLVLIMSFVVLFRQTLTLPGLAGVLLTLGMAVDANILILERYREERKKGKPVLPSLSAAYDRAFWVIFDSNLTTIITAYVLFYLGTPEVKGFAVTLISGLAASFFTSVFVTRLILSALCNLGVVKDLKLVEAFQTPRIPFVRHQRTFIAASVSLIVLSWGLVIWRGKENYGIDFTGGARVTMNLAREVGVEELREKINAVARLHPDLFQDYSIQTIEASRAGVSSTYTVLTRAGARGSSLKTASAEESQPAPAPADGAPAAQPPAPATFRPDEETDQEEAAQRVRRVLEEMLRTEGLLLPEPFPLVDWVPDTSPAAPPGSESLLLEVHLSRVDPDYTPERMRSDLNAEFERDPALRRTGREVDPVYKGFEVLSVEQVPGTGDIQRYRVKTSSYQAPGVGLRAGDPRPTQRQVEATVRRYFSESVDSQKVKLSEPFPQVLTVGPRVASSLQADAMVAIFVSLLGIIFYVSLRFEFSFGLAGIVALVHDAMFAIGMMAIADQFLPEFSIKFNLTEMAAVLSILGYSINDTIVLFDRVRENTALLAKRRYTVEEIFDISINQTLLRTVWTSLTTFVVVILLLAFGGEAVRGFAYIFAVGLLAGTYSTVFIASPVALWLQRRAQVRRQALASATS